MRGAVPGRRARAGGTDAARPRPGRTADEAAAEAGRALPDRDAELRAAARLFDDVWYGGRAATAMDAQLRAVDEAVRATAAGARR